MFYKNRCSMLLFSS